MHTLSDLLAQGGVALDVDATDVPACVHVLTAHLVDRGRISPRVADRLAQALQAREQLGSTGLGNGLAIPHAYVEGMPGELLVLARLKRPVDYGAPDGAAVDLLFLLSGPPEAQSRHLPVLARLVRLLHDTRLLDELRGATDVAAATEAMRSVEARHA